MSEYRVYMAIAYRDGFTVGRQDRHGGKVRAMFNVRTFENFEDTDECARRIASGEFEQWEAGRYINNR